MALIGSGPDFFIAVRHHHEWGHGHTVWGQVAEQDMGRGLHSSTFRLDVSAFCGIGGVIRGCVGGAYEVLGGIRGCLRENSVSEPAQVELKSGRVQAPGHGARGRHYRAARQAGAVGPDARHAAAGPAAVSVGLAPPDAR